MPYNTKVKVDEVTHYHAKWEKKINHHNVTVGTRRVSVSAKGFDTEVEAREYAEGRGMDIRTVGCKDMPTCPTNDKSFRGWQYRPGRHNALNHSR